MLDEIIDQAEELADRLSGAELAAELERRGRALEEGAEGRAAWLSLAGERWEMADNLARARWCFEDAARDGGASYVDPRAELVDVHLRLGETAAADGLLVELLRDLAAGRCEGPVHDYVGETLEEHGRLEEALRWFNAGLTRASADDAAEQELACLNGRFRVRRRLDLPHDSYDALCEQRRREHAAELGSGLGSGPGRRPGPRAGAGSAEPTHRQRRGPLVVLYWPPADFAAAIRRWPVMAEEYGPDHDGHRCNVERTLRGLAGKGVPVSVGTCLLGDFRAFAERQGDHAATAATRAGYAAHLGLLGHTRPWPPGRNEPCWCGSGAKYKRCCGALRF